MGILSWIVFGLIAGFIAKVIMPGRDPRGFIVTVLIGIAGAMVGGFIGLGLGWGSISGFNFHSFMLAVVGGIIVLFLYRVMSR